MYRMRVSRAANSYIDRACHCRIGHSRNFHHLRDPNIQKSRQRSVDFIQEKHILCFVEPVASVPPRLPPRSKADIVRTHSNSGAALLCDAQGQPIPSFRYIFKPSLYPYQSLLVAYRPDCRQNRNSIRSSGGIVGQWPLSAMLSLIRRQAIGRGEALN